MDGPRRIMSRSKAKASTGCLAVGLVLAAHRPALAESRPQPELRWEAPASCPTQSAVRANLDRLLAQVDPARREALDLRALARVTKSAPERFSLDLEVTTSEGTSTRHVDAATCLELADATTLLISMVDPAAAAQAEKLSPSAEPQSQPTPDPEPDPEPEPDPQLDPAPPKPDTTAEPEPPAQLGEENPTPPPRGGRGAPSQAGLGLDLSLGNAGLPGFGAGVGIHLGLLRRHFRGELFAHYQLPRTQALAGLDEVDAAVRYQLGAAGLRGCGTGTVGASARVELFGCLGAELGAMHGRGLNLPVSATHTGLWAAALVTPGLALRLTPRLAFIARGDLGIALSRPRFSVRNYGDAHRAPPVSFVLSLGLEVRLPAGPAVVAPTKKNRDGSGRSRAIPPGAP